jgi:hypothetical protein
LAAGGPAEEPPHGWAPAHASARERKVLWAMIGVVVVTTVWYAVLHLRV